MFLISVKRFVTHPVDWLLPTCAPDPQILLPTYMRYPQIHTSETIYVVSSFTLQSIPCIKMIQADLRSLYFHL